MFFLNATKFVYTKDSLFFLEENNGIFGKIDVLSGKIKLYENTPKEIFGNISYDVVLIPQNEYIYIIHQNGKVVTKFHDETGKFEKIAEFTPDKNIYISSWAGYIEYEDDVYMFSRDNGVYFKYNLKERLIEQYSTGITEKVMWICSDRHRVFILSWDYKSLYFFDLRNRSLEKRTITLDCVGDIKSKSFIPFHTISYDKGYLYLLDEKNLIRLDMHTADAIVLFTNVDKDNGARMIVMSQWIIIPAFQGKKIVVIDKHSGKIYKIITIAETVTYGIGNGTAKVGVSCESERAYHIPLVASDSFLSIDKENIDFKYTRLLFDYIDVERLIDKIIREKNVIEENALLNLEQFIRGVNTLK